PRRPATWRGCPSSRLSSPRSCSRRTAGADDATCVGSRAQARFGWCRWSGVRTLPPPVRCWCVHVCEAAGWGDGELSLRGTQRPASTCCPSVCHLIVPGMTQEDDDLDKARRGDRDAFGRLV